MMKLSPAREFELLLSDALIGSCSTLDVSQPSDRGSSEEGKTSSDLHTQPTLDILCWQVLQWKRILRSSVDHAVVTVFALLRFCLNGAKGRQQHRTMVDDTYTGIMPRSTYQTSPIRENIRDRNAASSKKLSYFQLKKTVSKSQITVFPCWNSTLADFQFARFNRVHVQPLFILWYLTVICLALKVSIWSKMAAPTTTLILLDSVWLIESIEWVRVRGKGKCGAGKESYFSRALGGMQLTVETKTGEIYRGMFSSCDQEGNVLLTDVIRTARSGQVSKLPSVFLRNQYHKRTRITITRILVAGTTWFSLHSILRSGPTPCLMIHEVQ